MATKKHNGKTEWINNMTKEFEGIEEVSKDLPQWLGARLRNLWF